MSAPPGGAAFPMHHALRPPAKTDAGRAAAAAAAASLPALRILVAEDNLVRLGLFVHVPPVWRKFLSTVD